MDKIKVFPYLLLITLLQSFPIAQTSFSFLVVLIWIYVDKINPKNERIINAVEVIEDISTKPRE